MGNNNSLLLGCFGYKVAAREEEEEEKEDSEDEKEEEVGPWADLPALAIHSIVTRLTSMRDLVACGGTCRHWRSVVTGEELVQHFARHHAPLMVVRSLSFFEKVFSFMTNVPRTNLLLVRMTDGKMHKRYFPGIEGSWFHGEITFGHRILMSPRPPHYDEFIDDIYFSRYESNSFIEIILLNVLTGAHIKFRAPAPPLYFEFASLTAQPTSPDCLLVLASNVSIQYLNIGGGACRWNLKEYQESIFSENVTSVVTIKDRLYVASIHGQVVELMIDPQRTATTTPSKPAMLSKEDSPASLHEIRAAEDNLGIFSMILEWKGKLILVHSEPKEIYQFNSSTRKWERLNQFQLDTQSLNRLFCGNYVL